MPYCWKCGNELKEDAKFCQKCGAPVSRRIRREKEPDWWE
ncbi:MAG: zinc-ribbon domain-containing protein [Candidatus Thorarchaeota archaeon]|nr:zinc-ribbon domain-containing protein [Candidatus Thorarchaeota archaeon]NIW14391.1 zinc-ribbon domain-containing protein [Candidatus Thorarchaeota archaeon]